MLDDRWTKLPVVGISRVGDAGSSRTVAMEDERMSLCCARAVVHDLLLEVWHVLAAEILSYAKSSRSSGSDDHP